MGRDILERAIAGIASVDPGAERTPPSSENRSLSEIERVGGERIDLDAPATPERVLMTIQNEKT